MALRTLIFALVMTGCAVGVLSGAIWPLCGYILHYSVGPERQWWAAPINQLGIRYSLSMAALALAGFMIHYSKLRFGSQLLSRTEKLMLAFLALIWLLALLMESSVGRYTTVDHPTTKMAKLFLFLFLLTHVATTRRHFEIVLWTIFVGGLILGIQAYETPYRSFINGRLERVGGPDFSDANRLAGYMAGLLPLIGAVFVRTNPRGRVVCFLAGGLVANTIVLTRCRGAVLGLAFAALVSVIMVPAKHRLKIIAGLLVGLAGFLYLADTQFLRRSSTITRGEDERDASAQSRVEIWRGAVRMLQANPLGVGPGNFYQNIGHYAPAHWGRDAHNTFVRCFGELGIPGILLLLGIFASTIATLRRILRESHHLPQEHQRYFHWTATGLAAAIAGAFGYGLTGTLLYTEYAWWLLALPICLERVLANVKEDLAEDSEDYDWSVPLSFPQKEAVG
jgi:O-antigen ligase